ncbi:hypothetical protein N8194_04250, partial [Akkermansiaceae bacterium]|nr:hypothetical protein [Akkermansiaceae bacterium]
ENGVVTVVYPRQLGADDAVIILQTSIDLESWSNQEAIPVSSDNASVVAQIQPALAAESKLFARLIIREK